MNISEVKNHSDCDNYCNGSDYRCPNCPITKECEKEYRKYQDESLDAMDFYNWKLNRIISYNRSRKIEKLLS